MTKRRTPDGLSFHCNAPDCTRSVELRTRDAATAWKAAFKDGWKMERIGGVFQHYCSWMHRPKRETTA